MLSRSARPDDRGDAGRRHGEDGGNASPSPAPSTFPRPLLALIGFSSAGLIIGFAFAREVNHPGASGAVSGKAYSASIGLSYLLPPEPVWSRYFHGPWRMASSSEGV